MRDPERGIARLRTLVDRTAMTLFFPSDTGRLSDRR